MTTVEQQKPLFLLEKEFFSVLQSVGAPKNILTLKQVLAYLQAYIQSRKLANPQNPKEFCLADDPLEGVFGTKTFTMNDVIHLLRKHIFRIPPGMIPIRSENSTRPEVPAAGDKGVFNQPAPVEKRKAETACEETPSSDAGPSQESKRQRHLEAGNASPMYLVVPPSPVMLSGDETELSLQGYETEYVKNSTDDLWFLDSDNESQHSSINDTYDVEYEVESVASDAGEVTDTDSEIEDAVCAALFLCKDDSDVPFWADGSDDEGLDNSSDDPEMDDGDKWTCKKCGSSNNRPTIRYCLKCWDERVGWLPRRNRSERHPPKRSAKKLTRNLSDPGYQSSQSTVTASQEGGDKTVELSQESQASTSAAVDLCPFCMVRAKTAVIIHGKTGHQVCCYKCGRKLLSLNQRCPTCRRSIQRVIRNFIV